MKLKVEQVKWITEHLKKMNSRKIIFRDPVVERVVDKFVGRSNVGFEKYGTTLQDERTMKMKGLHKYLTDIQEELMDAVLYIQAARDELQDLSEESLIQRYTDEDIEEQI
jgi:NACalpha-BTF3-like transcription factor